MVPAGPDDSRSSAQRRADGLAELAALALRTDELPRLSGTAASVDVLIGAHSLLDPTGPGRPGAVSTLGSHRAAWSGGEPSGVVLDHPGRPAFLPASSVALLLCDSTVGRIVLGADGVPLDLGRRVRTFSADQRRALAVRDAGCRFPGCDRPPRYTDVHHVVPWAQGGPTDLANGLLLCRWHHGRVHAPAERGGWRVAPVDDARGSHGPLLFRNDFGTELTSDPRGP